MSQSETEETAKQWSNWLAEDLKEMLRPMAEATGVSLTDVLLYLIAERLAQLSDNGISVHVMARHDYYEHPPDNPSGDEWKKP